MELLPWLNAPEQLRDLLAPPAHRRARGTRLRPPPRQPARAYPRAVSISRAPNRAARRAEASPRVRPPRSTPELRAAAAQARIAAQRHQSARVGGGN